MFQRAGKLKETEALFLSSTCKISCSKSHTLAVIQEEPRWDPTGDLGEPPGETRGIWDTLRKRQAVTFLELIL